MAHKSRNELILELLDRTDEQFSDEELMHHLIDQKVSVDVRNREAEAEPFAQRAADGVAKFVGSWAFIAAFLIVLISWMIVNILLASGAFDPYPFILLNLVLSCVAAIQAPLIMMSQNRQEAKDRIRAENDYRVNLKSELVIADLHLKLDHMIANQEKLLKRIERLERMQTPPEK